MNNFFYILVASIGILFSIGCDSKKPPATQITHDENSYDDNVPILPQYIIKKSNDHITPDNTGKCLEILKQLRDINMGDDVKFSLIKKLKEMDQSFVSYELELFYQSKLEKLKKDEIDLIENRKRTESERLKNARISTIKNFVENTEIITLRGEVHQILDDSSILLNNEIYGLIMVEQLPSTEKMVDQQIITIELLFKSEYPFRYVSVIGVNKQVPKYTYITPYVLGAKLDLFPISLDEYKKFKELVTRKICEKNEKVESVRVDNAKIVSIDYNSRTITVKHLDGFQIYYKEFPKYEEVVYNWGTAMSGYKTETRKIFVGTERREYKTPRYKNLTIKCDVTNYSEGDYITNNIYQIGDLPLYSFDMEATKQYKK